MIRRDIIPFSAEWHQARSECVGGSEVSGLFGLQSPTYGRSRWMLYQTKSGTLPEVQFDDARSVSGRYLEPGILAMAAAQEGWQTMPGGYARDDKEPHIGASLDAEILAPTEAVLRAIPGVTGMGVCDAKNVDWMIYRDTWPEHPNNPQDRIPPFRYQIQLQHQLAATNYTWAALAVLVGGNDLRITYYRRSEPVINLIREKVAELYDAINRGDEPPMDGSPVSSQAVRIFTRGTTGEIFNAEQDADFEAVCIAREAAAEAKKAAELNYAAADNTLRMKLGPYLMAHTKTKFVSGKPDKNGTRRYSVKNKLSTENNTHG